MNKARQTLFSRDNKVIKNNPRTKGALRQHVLQPVLQPSKWRQSLSKDFDGRVTCQWYWQKVKDEMIPLWNEDEV